LAIALGLVTAEFGHRICFTTAIHLLRPPKIDKKH